MPLDLDYYCFETMMNGMIDISPSLKSCEGLKESWNELSGEIANLQEDLEAHQQHGTQLISTYFPTSQKRASTPL